MIGILLVLGAFATLTVAVGTRRGRQTAIGHILVDILLSLRFVLWELPLRAITGRRRPDYARIASLQRMADQPLADLITKAERDAERECAPSLAHGTKTSGVSFANAETAALALVTAGYDPAAVLAATGSPAANAAPKPGRGTLAGMRPGDVCWAVPWALSADGDRLWLDAGYLAGRAPGGTATVRVERCLVGYHAWSEPGSEDYVTEAIRPEKSSGRQYLPVTWHSGYPGVTVRHCDAE